jgi:DNA-binding response OmpR family regulator
MVPTAVAVSLSSSPGLAVGTELLFVDDDPIATRCVPVLRETYRVAVAATADSAIHYLERARPTLVITELTLDGGSGVDICKAARNLSSPSTVLVTTKAVEQVPEALSAGCNGVLLKPFAPNLLYARIGRLLRERAAELRLRSLRDHAKSAHLTGRAELLAPGTNRVWPDTHCPSCGHAGVTSFEFASHRRAWYACLECKKVWIAKRQE